MKVFLSHSVSDEDTAVELSKGLAKEGFDVWNPRIEVGAGGNFAEEIGRALRTSDAMVILVSPAAMKSDWMQEEINYALTEPRFRNRVVPVILRPSSQMPWILNRFPTVKAGDNLAKTAREIARLLRIESTRLQPA